MREVVKGSVGLAVLVFVFTAVVILSGITNPIVSAIIFLVGAIGLNIAAVWWVLAKTAPESGYGKQLVNATLVGLIAGVLIFGSSLLTLTLIFPDHLDEVVASNIELLELSKLPDEIKQAQIEKLEATTPMSQAQGGLIGTFFTSLIVGAIVAIFKRKK